MVYKLYLKESRVEKEKKRTFFKNVKKKYLCVLGFSREPESIGDVCVYYYIIVYVYNLFI